MQKWVTLFLLVALFGVAVHAIVAGTSVAPAARSLLALSAIAVASCYLRRSVIRAKAREKPADMGDQRIAAFYLYVGASAVIISTSFVTVLTSGHVVAVTLAGGLCIVLAALCTAWLRV